jgi:hypothetical protein
LPNHLIGECAGRRSARSECQAAWARSQRASTAENMRFRETC